MKAIIEGYKNYLVDSKGNIYSIKRGKYLKGEKTKHGYMRVQLYNKDKPKKFFIHRLVAEAFIENPCNKPCVNHINGDKLDNQLSNLEWVTHSENEMHSYRDLGKKPPKSAFKKGCKQEFLRKKILQKTLDGDLVYEWDSQQDARRSGYNQPNINKVLKGERKSAEGYLWEYA